MNSITIISLLFISFAVYYTQALSCDEQRCPSCCSLPTGGVCFDNTKYTCNAEGLCPMSASSSCGDACFNPALYFCSSGRLMQLSEKPKSPANQAPAPATQAPAPATQAAAPATQAPAPATQAPVKVNPMPIKSTIAPTPAPRATQPATQPPATQPAAIIKPTQPAAIIKPTQPPATPAPVSNPTTPNNNNAGSPTTFIVHGACESRTDCGASGLLCCLTTHPDNMETESECYNPKLFVCTPKVMCPVGMGGCGFSCYNTDYYNCDHTESLVAKSK